MDDQQMELLCCDVSTFYSYLGRQDSDAIAKTVWNGYLLHDIMNKTISGDADRWTGTAFPKHCSPTSAWF